MHETSIAITYDFTFQSFDVQKKIQNDLTQSRLKMGDTHLQVILPVSLCMKDTLYQ